MKLKHLEFRLHAVERMFEREISTADVRHVIRQGKVIEDYPDDKPFPSCLILGHIGTKPLHLVLAIDQRVSRGIVVTVYEPDPHQWESGFERRKSR